MLAIVAVYLWELYALIFVNRTVKVPGQVPYRVPVMTGASLIFIGVYMYRWGVTQENIICAVMFLVAVGVFLFVRSGLTEHGVASNGRVMTYDKIQYYTVETGTNAGNVRIRFHGQRRETVLLFPEDQTSLVEAYMYRGEVPTLEGYRAMKRSQGN